MKVKGDLLHKYFAKFKGNSVTNDKADGQNKQDRGTQFSYGKSRTAKGKAKRVVKK